jgi:CRISPR-associated exonuclease Cas4
VSSLFEEEISITGTLVWYYYICPREVWLQSRQINPDEQDQNMTWGRYLHEHAYQREKKELSFGGSKFDFVQNADGQLLVVEVKKTDRYQKSAAMQLLFYLYKLKQQGIIARGELRFPEQKKIEPVELTADNEKELETALDEIKSIIQKNIPPPVERNKYCAKCAYQELCWA